MTHEPGSIPPTQEAVDKRFAEIAAERDGQRARAEHLREAAAMLEDEADNAERSADTWAAQIGTLSVMVRERWPHLNTPAQED